MGYLFIMTVKPLVPRANNGLKSINVHSVGKKSEPTGDYIYQHAQGLYLES